MKYDINEINGKLKGLKKEWDISNKKIMGYSNRIKNSLIAFIPSATMAAAFAILYPAHFFSLGETILAVSAFSSVAAVSGVIAGANTQYRRKETKKILKTEDNIKTEEAKLHHAKMLEPYVKSIDKEFDEKINAKSNLTPEQIKVANEYFDELTRQAEKERNSEEIENSKTI